MYGRSGLERFKKAESLEPFSVTSNTTGGRAASRPGVSSQYLQVGGQQSQVQSRSQVNVPQKSLGPEVGISGPGAQVTQVGGGQSTWKPPDWAIEPRPGVYYLEVLKDGQVIGQINLDKRRHIFGRQFPMCDYVLDHQSISRQHAAVVPHKNGSIYVIDLGSVHGTFVANERLVKDNPVELEVGQSLRFAASTRAYILRKNIKALLPPPPLPTEINLPPPPDPSDEEAVLDYNTFLNKYGLGKVGLSSKSAKDLKSSATCTEDDKKSERASKRRRTTKVLFRDQVGGELVQIVGVSDGAHVETEPGPMGVKEGSLVGKYESLVEITVIPKGKEQVSKENNTTDKGITDKLKEVLNKVKSAPKGNGIYDDLYGELYPRQVGSSWAYSSVASGNEQPSQRKDNNGQSQQDAVDNPSEGKGQDADDSDDLFGD